MDSVLLILQIVLVILLVVIPLFSGYDKWQGWSVRRRMTALILGAGVGVVAFGQYRRIVLLRKSGLQYVVGTAERGHSWYSRPVVVHPLEYIAATMLGGMLFGFCLQALQRRKWTQALGYLLLFLVFLGGTLAVTLRWWRF